MLILKEKGQAALEYILLFMISLFLTGGLVYQFNDAFRQYVNAYFGEYLTCLIEAGELPSLGYDGPAASECDGEFQPYDLANGRAPIGVEGYLAPPPPKPPGNGPKGPDFTPPPVPHVENKGLVDEKMNIESAGGGRQSDRTVPIRGGGSDSEYGIGGGRYGGSGGGGKYQEARKPELIGLSKEEKEASESSVESTGGGILGRYSRRKKSEERPMIISLNYSESEEAEKFQKPTRIPASEKDAQPPNRVGYTEPRKKQKAVDADIDGSLDFSDWIRYLVIAAILIVLALFLGGQALQISKSQEK